MIGPKAAPPSRAQEADAYELATIRDNNTCQRCHRDCGPLARDHRQNRQGGNTVVENLQCLGLICHQWKTEHPLEANRTGWGVPRWADPAEWPARRYVKTMFGALKFVWVLYDNAGGWIEISDAEARERMKGVR